jgi:hypothetical protein
MRQWSSGRCRSPIESCVEPSAISQRIKIAVAPIGIQATSRNPFAVCANTVDRKRRKRENLKPRNTTRMTEVLVTLRG